MGVVFFFGFLVVLFLIGMIFIPGGTIFRKKHKVVSIILYSLAGLFSLPLVAFILFLTVMYIQGGKDRRAEMEKEGKVIYNIIRTDDEKKILKLIEKEDIFITDENGEDALHHASVRGMTEVVSRLIEKGCDVNRKTKSGQTALHVASSPEIAEILIASGADVNAEDEDGETPLHERTRLPEVCEVLIKHGADVNRKDICGNTPLNYGASTIVFEKKAAKVFVDAGADVNSRNDYGNTPLLSCASRFGEVNDRDIEVMKYLIENGADISVKNNEGCTMKDYVIEDLKNIKERKYGEEYIRMVEDFVKYIEDLEK